MRDEGAAHSKQAKQAEQSDDAPQQHPSASPAGRAAWWQAFQRRVPAASLAGTLAVDTGVYTRRVWKSPVVSRGRRALSNWRNQPYSGPLTLVAGCLLITLVVMLSRQVLPLPTLGAAYIPLIAMLAYYWGWALGLAACLIQLVCVYLLLLPPRMGFKVVNAQNGLELLVLAAISVYVLLLVQLARNRRDAAEREVVRFAALNAVGTALAGELHEDQLLHLIARTACELTGAGFAAFTLRPVDVLGRPIGPSEGSHFHLAAVVGVTPEQEDVFRRVPLGGEGLLAPIFRHGVVVRVDDALAQMSAGHHAALAASASDGSSASSSTHAPTTRRESPRDVARRQASSFAQGNATVSDLRAVGIPRGHPIVRSFLGAPLLDREGNVRGGLLLGHMAPERFTKDDETLLQALAAQASVALENVRLYHNARSQAEELNAVFESISDGVMVYDQRGGLIHENHAATVIRALLAQSPEDHSVTQVLKTLTAGVGGDGSSSARGTFSCTDAHGETHDYAVNVSPLQGVDVGDHASVLAQLADHAPTDLLGSTVMVWHEITETRRLLAEQQARAEAETQRALLQQVLDESPSGTYLVRGHDAALVLANHSAQEVWGAHWVEGQTMADFLATSGTQIVGSGGRPLATDELATVQALRTGEAIRHYQEVIRRPDGTALPVLLNAVALDPHMLVDNRTHARAANTAADSGAQTALEPVALVVLQDVTAIKEAEQLKDEFIAIAAHELKTPMAAVKGYADMLVRHTQREDSTPLEPWQIEALETIDQATNRLVELTEDLLDVARLQADRIQLHCEPHDLIALARRVAKRFQMASERHTLVVDAQEDFIVAQLDVRRTEQILGNLLSNAIKYSPDGGQVTITIEQDAIRQIARLAIHDEGIGIPAGQQAMLFNRFARADNARERGIAGTGLGLYLCRELAELQGGQLWFTSEEGHGSTFFLTLPLAEETI